MATGLVSFSVNAALCAGCTGKVFTADMGECGNCDAATTSGDFKLCTKCSDAQRRCQACGGGLTVTKPVTPTADAATAGTRPDVTPAAEVKPAPQPAAATAAPAAEVKPAEQPATAAPAAPVGK